MRRGRAPRRHGLAIAPTVLAALAVVVFSLAIKFAYLHERRSWPDFERPTMDARIHDEWACALATGHWTGRIAEFRESPYYRAPLYPWLLSFVYRALGRDLLAAYTLQVIAGCACVLLIGWIASTLYGRTAAIASMLLALGYWPLTYFDADLTNATLSVLLVLLIASALIQSARRPVLFWWSISGLCIGIAALTVPLALLTLPAILLWMWHVVPARRAAAIFTLLASTALAIAPVTIRNVVVGRDFVPIASNGGVNLYIGNNPESNGLRAVLPGARADWWGGYDDASAIAERETGRQLRPSEVSTHFAKRALAFWRTQPRQALRLLVDKLVLVTGDPEPSNNRQLYFRRSQSQVLRLLPFGVAFILAGAVVGSMGLLRRSAGLDRVRLLLPLLASSYLVAVALFFVTSRHRLPGIALLIPTAGYAVAWVSHLARQKAWRRLVLTTATGVVVLLFAQRNPQDVGRLSDSRGWYDLGTDYLDAGDARASACFERSLAADSAFAPAWRMYGVALERAGHNDRAIAAAGAACLRDSLDAENHFVYGRMCQERGRTDAAIVSLQYAVRLDPGHYLAWNNLAEIRLRQGRMSEARALLNRTLTIAPDFVNARFGLGLWYELVGDVDSARTVYEELGPYGPAQTRLRALGGK